MGPPGRHADRHRPVSEFALRAFAAATAIATTSSRCGARAFPTTSTPPSARSSSASRIPTRALFVAHRDGALVGTIMAGSDGHRGWLHYVAVTPAQRRHGVARALVAHAERWLATRGVSKINLQIRGDNLAVQAFYERVGYRVEDRVSLGKRIRPPGRSAPPPVARGEPGALEFVVTHLEMDRPPATPPTRAPALKLAVLRAETITLPFYRYLYAEIGRDWVWWMQRPQTTSDEALAAVLRDAAVDVFVLYASGEPGGMSSSIAAATRPRSSSATSASCRG